MHSGRRLLGLLTRFFSDSVKRRPFRLRTVITGIGDSLVLRAPESLPKGLGFESQLEWRGDFYSLLSTLCAALTFGGHLFHHPHLLLQYHVKDPGHSAESAGGRLQLITHAPCVCGFEWSDTANWCMDVWCTQNVP